MPAKEESAMSAIYDSTFFDHDLVGSQGSASIIAPLVYGYIHPSSVLDVGCGTGVWLREFARLGAVDYFGVDAYAASANRLEIPIDHFKVVDLNLEMDLGRRFDLVISLEVAEHVEPESAEVFIDSLCSHSDAVLFSAAVPEQGGTGHVNEQWQSYWAAKFESRGFQAFDLVRPVIWNDDRVDDWYRQNTLLYARGSVAQQLRSVDTPALPLNLVHPKRFVLNSHPHPLTIRESFRSLNSAVRRRVSVEREKLTGKP
jgi:SAM-dependent methyltransferase